ncbi:MAG: pantoate--beta-alanine ligase [Alphaproteobacteria bacterium]|nr:pantoate--beta-alanine ligase [Alphaproteobacteria bacterium]
MIIAHSKQELEEIIAPLKEEGRTIGFVPTMGALHAGHLSLVDLARRHADKIIVSIFVNPTQFAPHEDFDAYPRDLEGDAAKLDTAGVDIVYAPRETDIYPDGKDITVKAGAMAKGLEGDFRPTHFDGVVTVVHRLFSQVQPDVAVFGEKDFQQLQVIKEMAAAERLSVEIVGGLIARDEHGLALSSRNAYLSAEELEIARKLNKILRHCAEEIARGRAVETATQEAENALLEAGFDKIDYVRFWQGRVLAAAFLGRTRLIDNIAA